MLLIVTRIMINGTDINLYHALACFAKGKSTLRCVEPILIKRSGKKKSLWSKIHFRCEFTNCVYLVSGFCNLENDFHTFQLKAHFSIQIYDQFKHASQSYSKSKFTFPRKKKYSATKKKYSSQLDFRIWNPNTNQLF